MEASPLLGQGRSRAGRRSHGGAAPHHRNALNPAQPPLLTRDFALLTLAHLLQACGWASMLLLPLYLDHLGASHTQIGGIMGVAAIGGLLARPLVGWGLDQWGRRKTITAGTLFVVAAMALVGLVDAPDEVAYGVRIIFGIGVGAMFSGYFAFVADLIPESRRTEGIALFGVSGLVPLAINPISAYVGVDAAALQWFLPLMGGVILLSLVPLWMVREPPIEGGREPLRVRAVVEAMSRRELWPVWAATIAFSGLAKLFMAFATVAASHRGLDVPADFWATYAAGAVGVRLLGARLPDRLGAERIVAPAIALDVLAAIVLAESSGRSGVLVAGLLGGLGHGYCFPVLASLVVTRSPDALRGSALAMYTALWEVTGLTLPPLFGALGDSFGDAVLFWAAAGWGGAGIAAWWLLQPPPART